MGVSYKDLISTHTMACSYISLSEVEEFGVHKCGDTDLFPIVSPFSFDKIVSF